MQIEKISDLTDPRLGFFTRLTDVSLRTISEPKSGLFLAESTKVIERAIQTGHRPVSVITLEKWLPKLETVLAGHDIPVFVGRTEILESLTGFVLHRGAIAAMERPDTAPVSEIIENAKTVVVLENITDHTNVGAIFRSVAALGANAVLITPECADPFYRRSIRVSMGTVLQVPWTRIPRWPDGITQLHNAGFTVAALALGDESISLEQFVCEGNEKVALVFGTEGHGLNPKTLELCDRVVRIPMSNGVDSLNVAASSAVTLYALSLRRFEKTQ